MFVPFLIMLREGLEAALIVKPYRQLSETYPARTLDWRDVDWRDPSLRRSVWGWAFLSTKPPGEFPRERQELFEGIVAVIAVVILTWMVFWMRKVLT